jgi:heat shock protein HslJ
MRHLPLTLAATLTLQPTLALACDPPPVFDGDPAMGVSVSVGRIADVIWVPLEIDGAPVPEGTGLALAVSFEGKVEGTTGCNRFTGTAEMDAGELILGPLAVTEMACADSLAMAREAAWLKALGEVRWFVVSPKGLWLRREDGSVAACLN